MSKPFALGLVVGRFQTLHKGHEEMLRTALAVCEQVAVLIGSAQESGTQRNPFSYVLREELLRQVFGDAILIRPLEDIGVGNTAAWGSYILTKCDEWFGRCPDLFVSGRESRRVSWFGEAEIAELFIPKRSRSARRTYVL